MYVAIRGATTVGLDSAEEIAEAVQEMLQRLLSDNALNAEDLVAAWFTVTQDLRSANPATVVRKRLELRQLPMMCMQEADCEGSMPRCIRILLQSHWPHQTNSPKHVYLREAQTLRTDWT